MEINFNPNLLSKLIRYARAFDLKEIDLRCRHFAFIINKNKLISIGVNSRKSHPLHKKYGYYNGSGLHAEMNSIIKSGSTDHHKNTMVTFRIDGKNQINNGRPCVSCIKLIREAGFKRVFYSCVGGNFELLNLNK